MSEPKLRELLNQIKDLEIIEIYVLSLECVGEIKRRMEDEKINKTTD